MAERTPISNHLITLYDSQLSHPEQQNPCVPYFRDSPLRLLIFDASILLRHAPQIPNIFLPLTPGADISAIGVLAQVVFVCVSLGVTGLAGVSIIIGIPPFGAILAVVVVVVWVMSRLQGKVKVEKAPDMFEDEAWLFVNGIATSASGLQLILTRLHKIFGRRVIGIHNKTFGIWWDLVECCLQRDFMWATEDVRVGYETICNHIRNPKKKKVVLIAHSQGGIIMSTWVDQLLSDFPSDVLRKVEIYTFAAAANHFSVPSTAFYPEDTLIGNSDVNAPSQESGNEASDGSVAVAEGKGGDVIGGEDRLEAAGTGSRQIGRRFVLGAVEHFVNTKDYVGLIGILEFAPPAPTGTVPGVLPTHAAEGRFAGRIFKREGHTGHLLLAHYLKDTNSILDHPTVIQYSQLARYKNGARSDPPNRYWKPTNVNAARAPTQTKPSEGFSVLGYLGNVVYGAGMMAWGLVTNGRGYRWGV